MSETRDDQMRSALRERILRAEEAIDVLLELTDQYGLACVAAMRDVESVPFDAPLSTFLALERQRSLLSAEFEWSQDARDIIEHYGRHAAAGNAQRARDERLGLIEHPGVIFRDGPSGPRPALIDGPDVWEVVDTFRHAEEDGGDAVSHTAAWGSLTPEQVRTALAYYEQYRSEIDAWIEGNHEAAERWRAEPDRGRSVPG